MVYDVGVVNEKSEGMNDEGGRGRINSAGEIQIYPIITRHIMAIQ